MKTRVMALALASFAGCLAAGPAMAQDSGLLVRVRATYLDMQTKSSGEVLPVNAIDVNSKWIPELDVSYFFTRNLAAELVLTVPQKQKVSVGGAEIGTFRHLPPTLLAQWHFDGLGAIKPYVGLGINYTLIDKERMWVGSSAVSLSNDSWGPAMQIGADYKLTSNWYLNADIKKIYIKSSVYLDGDKISTVKLNPYAFSLGVGYRF